MLTSMNNGSRTAMVSLSRSQMFMQMQWNGLPIKRNFLPWCDIVKLEDAIFFLVAAAGQLQSTEDAKAQAERQQMQLQDELAGQKATEGRLRERLAKREARSLERKQVGAACHHCCFVGKANRMEFWIPMPYLPCLLDRRSACQQAL
jgi:hypothetical protein